MRPDNLKTRIFLDSGNPEDTAKMIQLLGFLDGQTTNPSLVAQHPDLAAKLARDEKLSEHELLEEYKKIITTISQQIPNGSVSVEVYADANTTADQMVKQAKEMNTWIPNAHIKIPCIMEGLKAVEILLELNIRVNITLIFTQSQAAAVHSLCKGVKRGDVFLSPFAGRLEDQLKDGMDTVMNIIRMYKENNSPVEVLTASIRDLDHFLYSLYIGTDIITSPYTVLEEWANTGKKIPGIDLSINEFDNEDLYFAGKRDEGIADVGYVEYDLNMHWREFDLTDTQTDNGLQKFARDWNNLLKKI